MPDANGKPLRADANTPNPILGNTAYDIIKDVVTIAFPALVTLYAGIAVLWGWPFTDQVVATAGLVITFLGVLLKIAQKRYEQLPVVTDGTIVIPDPADPTAVQDVDLVDSPLADREDTVTLKVVR